MKFEVVLAIAEAEGVIFEGNAHPFLAVGPSEREDDGLLLVGLLARLDGVGHLAIQVVDIELGGELVGGDDLVECLAVGSLGDGLVAVPEAVGLEVVPESAELVWVLADDDGGILSGEWGRCVLGRWA